MMKLWSKPRGNAEHQKKENAKIAGINKKLIITLVAVAAAIIVAVIALSVYAFSYDKAFAGVTVGGQKVAGMTQAEIEEVMSARGTQEYDAVEFDIKVDENVTHVTANDFKAERDSAAAAQAAMNVGREGSVLKRMWTVFTCLLTKHDVALSALLDDEAINAVVTKIAQQNNVAAVDAAYQVDGAKMTITPPVDGLAVDEEALREQILNRFDTEKYEDIVISTQVAQAKRLDMDEVYAAVHKEVADATMTDEGGSHKIVPHVVGVDFDLAAAKTKLEENPDAKFEVALKITNPKVTTIMLESKLFKDVLSESTSYFSPKKVARTHNVRLAANLINGKVLNPGETFSYNETVGPRTRARGFKEAAIFSKGEIVDGLGGGICQVSSTLYMAAMKADMKTVSRKNHSFYVDYAPKGQDATVVYGSIDFKFQNTSEYPVKVVAYQKNNYITVKIMGTRTAKKTVKITSKVLSTKPFTEKIINDNTLKPGERVIEQKGQEGITMDVYRSVYDANGKLITSYKENRTKYIPLTQIVRVGPAASGAAATAPSVPAPTTPPAETKPETPAPAPEKEPEAVPETPAVQPEVESTPSEQPPAETPPAEQESEENSDEQSAGNQAEENAVEQTPAE